MNSEETLNLLLQADNVPYSRYEHIGFLQDESLGRSAVAENESLVQTLKQCKIGKLSLVDYIDFKKLGRDVDASGILTGFDKGFISEGSQLNLHRYSKDEIEALLSA